MIIQPGNPYDFTNGDLQDLVKLIQKTIPDLSVEIDRKPERGYGVTLIEVLNIWLQVADGATATVGTIGLVGAIKQWIQARRMQAERDHPESQPRPVSVTVHGADGAILCTLTIEGSDGNVRVEPGSNDPDSDPGSDAPTS
ncbi:conserved hypothetical protein [Frankia sp. AiPs1]|uniref:hypothetical protein n=1 Tax=Frankia sp. AiPa1 TaxID=573492 RepID=UPI00202B8D63|nr:hypothetical protein [Frankia sp. AiPa1]MCL9759192.1 hypothetical protein [Frankia sp. AiPa1]